MGRLIRPILTLLLALFTRPTPTPAPASSPRPSPAIPDAPGAEPAPRPSWYEPSPDDFRPAFGRHRGGAAPQAWDGYWSWVRTFYEGGRFARGWTDRARWLVDEVRSPDERGRLRDRLNDLGRTIAAEWARDYDVRRVSTADLLAWGKLMEKARARDAGDGAEIHRVLDAIDRDVRGKVGESPAGRDPVLGPRNQPEAP